MGDSVDFEYTVRVELDGRVMFDWLATRKTILALQEKMEDGAWHTHEFEDITGRRHLVALGAIVQLSYDPQENK